MKIQKMIFLLFFFLCFFITGIFSQEVSEKNDVSVFDLSYYGWKFPEEALGSADSTIRKVFVDMGRFRVLEVRKRFDNNDDLYDFIERIKKIKEKEVEISDEVSFGHVIFTESDFDKLISSFIVIIPEITFFDLNKRYNDDGDFIGYEAILKTSYTVMDARTMEVVAKPEIETSGFSPDRQQVWQDAIESIPALLEFELKKIPIFTLKTGVLEVHGGNVTLEKGKNMGIYTGFEFEIVRTKVLSSGFNKESSVGLVLVHSVFEEISEATVLYGDPEEGDQLIEIPRMGVDFILYAHILYNLDTETISILPGLEVIASRGFYSIKPVFGIELVIADLMSSGANGYLDMLSYYGVPINVYGGISYNLYMGRLQIAPTAVVGLTVVAPYEEEDDGWLTHVGGKGYLALNYLYDRDMKISFDIGYSSWLNISDYFKAYGGVLAGLEIVFKL
ncbi:MAG: hypothetical protein JXJ04_02060 [Spirochaetales bacterium]|nr:hypothetical protein [Spirochaetales bacterium]